MEAFTQGTFTQEALSYEPQLEGSWLKRELDIGRNFAQAVSKRGLAKFLHIGAQYLTGGRGIFDEMMFHIYRKTSFRKF